MSCSCRKNGVAVSFFVWSCAAGAADTYFQPQVELRAESSSNYNLDPVTNDQSDTYGAVADLAGVIGIATPRSETTLRPRLRLQSYKDREDEEEYEASFDLKSEYESERSTFVVFGRYSRQNLVNAEISDAEFDDIDPDDPSVPETGSNQVGETRQRLDFRPSYFYRVSERASIGAELAFQGVRYSEEVSLSRVEYDFMQGVGFLRWAIDDRSDFTVGAYASKYEAKEGIDQTDAVGGIVGVSRNWSERAASSLEISYEQNDATYGPVLVEDRTNDWGVSFSTYLTGDVDQWRFAAGRIYAPNGRGSKSEFDQFHVQYDRDISERLHFTGAARYVKDNSIGDVGSVGDREHSRLELSLTWFASPKMFVRGGYQYTYQDKSSDPDVADDNRLMLGIGYRGLGRASR